MLLSAPFCKSSSSLRCLHGSSPRGSLSPPHQDPAVDLTTLGPHLALSVPLETPPPVFSPQGLLAHLTLRGALNCPLLEGPLPLHSSPLGNPFTPFFGKQGPPSTLYLTIQGPPSYLFPAGTSPCFDSPLRLLPPSSLVRNPPSTPLHSSRPPYPIFFTQGPSPQDHTTQGRLLLTSALRAPTPSSPLRDPLH